MKKITVIGAAMALLAIGYSAQAQLSLSGVWSGASVIPPGGPSLTIDWSVVQAAAGDPYTYTYDLILPSGDPLTSFTLAAYTPTAAITQTGGADVSAVEPASIDWVWLTTTPTTATVAFTSDFGPAPTSFTLNDTVVDWGNTPATPPSLLAPAPVPEASTIMAGALMILPLGIGAFRVLRKERIA